MPDINIPPELLPDPPQRVRCSWCGIYHAPPVHCNYCGQPGHVGNDHCRQCGDVGCTRTHCAYCGRESHSADAHCAICRRVGCTETPCTACGWCLCEGPCDDCGQCGCQPCDECDSCDCNGPCDWCRSCGCDGESGCPSSPYHRPFPIHGYSYRPNLTFHGTGPLFLGMELEIETGRRTNDALTAVRDNFGDLVFCKEDGSISNGFEIVTHPMGWDYVADHFPWQGLTALRRAGASTVEERNGIHVHLSRAGFDGAPHVYSWMKFLHRNKAKVTAIARRDSGQWAAWDDNTRRLQKYIVKPALAVNPHTRPRDRHGRMRDVWVPNERYQAINCQNTATFELRVFASSLDQDEVAAALALSSSSVEYTRALTSQQILKGDGWSWPAFTEWLDSRPTYAPLRKEISRLCVS